MSILVAIFCLPATAKDYPESLKWWTGQIAGIDGDAVKNAVFALAVLAFLAFTVARPPGKGSWPWTHGASMKGSRRSCGNCIAG